MCEQSGKDTDDCRLQLNQPRVKVTTPANMTSPKAELARQCQSDNEEDRRGCEPGTSSTYDRLRTAAGCCYDRKQRPDVTHNAPVSRCGCRQLALWRRSLAWGLVVHNAMAGGKLLWVSLLGTAPAGP